MEECLRQGGLAAEAGEVPVGAVVVHGGRLLASGHNSSIQLHDPTAHAEIVALRRAGARLGNYRLAGAELFVTVEPCLMCVGAALQARVGRIVYGCRDPKGGALGSVADFSAHPALNHRLVVTGGVREEESRRLLQEFFRTKRE
jgi:tRNA(adenine34) deaminase